MKTSRIDELRNDILAFKRFLMLLWRNRKLYIRYISVAVVVGMIVAFSIPKNYSSTTILALEHRQTGYNAAVMSLAGMAGINLGFLSEDAYSADLYPTIISSQDFVRELAGISVRTSDDEKNISYAQHLLIVKNNTWWGNAIVWVKGLFGSDKAKTQPAAVSAKVVGLIRGNVRCQVNKLQGLVTITVYDKDPMVCKSVADSVAGNLNAFIQNYRTRKTRADYEALSQICNDAKARYLDAQSRYQNFIKENSSKNGASYKAQRDFLEGEAELAYASYNQMSAQVLMAQVKLQEATPVYNVVQSSYVPEVADSPAAMTIVILFIVCAFMVATVKITYLRVSEKLWGV